MLDLVVEPAERDVDEAAAGDVTAHEDLAAQEVDLEVLGHDGHALVVRCERAAHVQAEERKVQGDEHDSLDRGEHGEDEDDVAHEAGTEEEDLDAAARDGLATEDALEALVVQVDAFEEQQREEEEALVRGEPAREGVAPRGGLRGGEREHRQVDVRVDALFVRVAVVLRVLVLPPAVAQADEEVRDDERGPLVPLPRDEHLPVGGVVTEERGLGHDDRGDDRGDELPPGVTDEDERGDERCPHDDHADELGPVVGVAPSHEAGILDEARDLSEVRDRADAGRRGRHCRAGRGERCAHRGSEGRV